VGVSITPHPPTRSIKQKPNSQQPTNQTSGEERSDETARIRTMAAADPRCKHMCFTWNNTGETAPQWNEAKMSYLVYQLERGENGTLHWQGYVEFKRSTRFTTAKNLLGGQGIHFEQRRGTAQEASDYCQKDDTRVQGSIPVRWGLISPVPAPGRRNDLKEFTEEVKSGKRKRDIVDNHYGTLARYPKFYNTLTLMTRPRTTEPPQVILLIGEPGLGKTRYVYERHNDDDELYVTPLSYGTPWYDEYD